MPERDLLVSFVLILLLADAVVGKLGLLVAGSGSATAVGSMPCRGCEICQMELDFLRDRGVSISYEERWFGAFRRSCEALIRPLLAKPENFSVEGGRK